MNRIGYIASIQVKLYNTDFRSFGYEKFAFLLRINNFLTYGNAILSNVHAAA